MALVLLTATVLMLAVPYLLSDSAAERTPATRPVPSTPAMQTAPPSPALEPVDVLVVGDSYTVGSAEGGVGAANWTALVTADLQDVTLDVAAEGGRGYVSTGPAGGTFLDLLERAEGDYDVVLVFGSRNDRASGPEVRRAATRAFTLVESSWPDAELLVIGPPWVDEGPPAYVRTSRLAVQAAAGAAGATFVDPLAEGWFTGSARRYIGEDRIHPTNAGHEYLARVITPSLREAVERART